MSSETLPERMASANAAGKAFSTSGLSETLFPLSDILAAVSLVAKLVKLEKHLLRERELKIKGEEG